MLSTERLCHDIYVLFGDVSYDVRNVLWRLNNTRILRKASSHLLGQKSQESQSERGY